MKVRYDKMTDTLLITFKNNPVEDSDELQANLIADYDEQGNMVRLEILNATEVLDDATNMEFGFLLPDDVKDPPSVNP